MIWYTADLDGHTNPTPLRSLTYFVGGAVGGVAASYTVGSNLLAATWAYLYPKAFGSDLRGFVETGIDSYGKNESLSGPLITNLVNKKCLLYTYMDRSREFCADHSSVLD